MKLSILGILVVLVSSVVASAAQTADVDVSVPLDEVQGLATTEEQPQTSEEIQPSQAPLAVSDNEPLYYILSYATENIADIQKVLQNQLEIIYYIPDHHYIVKATAQQLRHLQDKDIVLDYSLVRDNSNRYRLGTDPKETLYYVYAFQTADAKQIARQLSELGYNVIDVNTYVIVVDMNKVQDIETALREMVSIEGVEAAEQRPHYELLNDVTNVVVGTTDIRQRFGLYGAGQIIAIADTGLDTGVLSTLHPDIRGRVISLTRNEYDPGNFCNYNGVDDPNGHGTLVTGAALGNGLQSGSNPSQHSYPLGSYAGAAPEARLVFQAAGCGSSGSMSADLPINLYNHAYVRGARIHSNSYGGVADGGYYTVDRDSDQYINTHKNFNILFAGGNNGVGTMKVQNTGKNVITVGGFSRDQPTTQWHARGPTKDNRFKPDILSTSVANIVTGEGITSTKSSIQVPWPTGAGNNCTTYYCDMGGTSIAAPNVAGAAAVVREYLMTQRSVTNPSASLVKAILLNSGDSITLCGPNAWNPTGQCISTNIPSPDFGWGRMNLSQSFADDMINNFAFWDVTTGLATNGIREYTILVNENRPLRITLDWTDREACPEPTCSGTAPKLVNDLDLIVTDTNGQVYYGNDLTAPYNNQPDRRNNVERVEVAAPVPGYYTVRVRGYNIPVGTQDFALVASYENYNSLLGCIHMNVPYPANIVC